MTPERVPVGWQAATYGDALLEDDARAGEDCALPVLSVTKTRGPMLASERFGKALHSRDLSRYRVAPRESIVADPMLLWDGSIGIQRAVDAGLVSPDYRVYQPSALVDSSFMAFLVRSPTMLPFYQGGARGTNVRRNRIARSDFLAIPLALPPLPEQRKIAAILTSVDDAIEATQAVIDQLGVVKKAMMAELLTRGLPGRHTRFKKTEIGEVPEGWEVVDLGSVILEGPTNGIYKPAEKIGRGALVAGMTAIEGESIEWSLCRRAELEDVERIKFALRRDDLLVRRVYARVEGVGRFIVVPEPPELAAYESNMMRVRVDVTRVLPSFVAAHMSLDHLRREIEQRATLGAQASINNDALRRLPLRLPSVAEQASILELLASVEDRTRAECNSLLTARFVKSALMSVLLTGEVRVTPDEAA